MESKRTLVHCDHFQTYYEDPKCPSALVAGLVSSLHCSFQQPPNSGEDAKHFINSFIIHAFTHPVMDINATQ